jgi:ArsR family transcriptional regulator
MPTHDAGDLEAVLKDAAELFGLLSAPMRLHIISALCHGEKNVGQLIEAMKTTQSNMSQHLNQLYRQGILSKRRKGAQIYYAIADHQVVQICQAMCDRVKHQR